eukprot:TRINITY_DN479_c0_g1_i1.p5 TRINITY_DN479_c0_g1~~TRINITY_DN479_c0_g1_i1.p5  ORF type:complete len:52 (+),score=5.44 TRINITY_DN479_c0_g1_i1:285-440(+)
MMLDFDPDNEKLRQPRSDKGSCLIALKKMHPRLLLDFLFSSAAKGIISFIK